MAVASVADGLRGAFEKLNERERKLVILLGVVLGLIVVVLPLYLMTSSISDIEKENQEIAQVLRDVSRARPMLAQRAAEREASLSRYETRPPALRQFVAAKGDEAGLPVRETVPQPDQVVDNFTRHQLRVVLPGVGLRPVVEMIANIDNSPYPVAVSRLHVEHFRSGDRYNVQVDVISYERAGASEREDQRRPREERAPEGAGPPAAE